MEVRDDAYWARFFGVRAEQWQGAGTLFRPHVGLRGYCGVWCFRRRDRMVVSAPQAWLPRLQALWGTWEASRLLDPKAVRASLADACDRCIGPAFHGSLDAQRLRAVRDPQTRPLGPSDSPRLQRFRHRCGAQAWSVSGLPDTPGGSHAHVHAAEITAMAAVRPKGERVGDICVLTDPSQRRRGLGAAVVSAAAEHALSSGTVVLYQTLQSNRAAVNLALAVGFRRYAEHLAIRLVRDA